MDISISQNNFAGRKNPKLHMRRKQLKNLKAKEAELIERCKLMEANCEALEIPLKKVTPLAYDNPNTPLVSNLWKLSFDAQYNFINGSYSEYKNSKILYAKEAVANIDLLKFVNPPIQINGPVSIFSKIGRNMLKNKFLDMFRIKTPEEKQLSERCKEMTRRKIMHEKLGIN